jgi:hypothetical protein
MIAKIPKGTATISVNPTKVKMNLYRKLSRSHFIALPV